MRPLNDMDSAASWNKEIRKEFDNEIPTYTCICKYLMYSKEIQK